MQDRQEDLEVPTGVDGLTRGLRDIGDAGGFKAWITPLVEPVATVLSRCAGAEQEIPATWRRRLDPYGRGLTMPQLLTFRAARRHLIGRPACTPVRAAPRVRPGRRVSHGRRPGHRRSGSTSRTASADPPDDGEQPGDPTFTAQRAVVAR